MTRANKAGRIYQEQLRKEKEKKTHRTAPLYTHIPGALPARRPSMASASSEPIPSSRSSGSGYMKVLKEKRIARVFPGRRVTVWSSQRRKAYLLGSVDCVLVIAIGWEEWKE